VRGISDLERGLKARPYQATVQMLAEALQLAPRERATFESAARRRAVPPRESLRDLSEHPLADVQRPEQVYQAVAAGLPGEFPPLRSLESVPHNLPLQLTSFVGRDQEIAEVTRLLNTSRLLTLTGAGGAGKTRLALQVAADQLPHYPQGVWLVELAPLADAAMVPRTLAAVLGLREDGGRPLPTLLAEILRPRHLLLVLDNCEHLIAACAHLADTLLRACPQVKVLATSREALAIAGETVWRVPSLTFPHGHSQLPMEDLARYEAVRLFLERAVAAQPGFELTSHNLPAVAGICRRLDGIPLALELAATRVATLGVEPLAARLDQRFRLLTAGSRTALPRQQTLRATVDWSYSLLSPQEQVVFTRLSVFAGGCTWEAAEAVCSGGEIVPEDILDLLGRLAAKSLVLAEPSADGTVRYRLLETLRQYGRERLLVGGEPTDVHERHAAYYLALAEEAEPHLKRHEQLVWFARIEEERDNLRMALQWYLERGAALEGLRLHAALAWFRFLRGQVTEDQASLTQFLALPAAQGPSKERARALVHLGMWLWIRGESVGWPEFLEDALALGRQVGDQPTEAWALLMLGALTPQRRARLEESLALYRVLGDDWGAARALLWLGELEGSESNAPLSRALLEESLALARHTGDRVIVAMAVQWLGDVDYRDGNLALADLRWQEALRLCTEVGDVTGMALVENARGDRALRQGDHAAARTSYQASLQLQHGWQGTGWIAASLVGLATVALAEGQPARALRLVAAGMALREARGEQLSEAEQQDQQRVLELARAALDEGVAAAACAEGQAMTLEQAIAYALEETATIAGATREKGEPGALSGGAPA
jgi:predicted ATPase